MLVGVAVGLFVMIVIGTMPAAATPCTNLQSLQLQHTTITSATDWAPGTFPEFAKQPYGLLPCHSDVNANVRLSHQHRGLAAGDELERQILGNWRRRLPGPITSGEYSELATGIGLGFATAISDLGTGSSGCNSLYCGSAGNMGNPVAIASGDPSTPSTGLFGHPGRIKNFGYRAIHLMTLRGKEIVKAFYLQNAQTAYFDGFPPADRTR